MQRTAAGLVMVPATYPKAWQYPEVIYECEVALLDGSPKVFLIEDETMLAMLIEIMLDELGYNTPFHASTLEDGMEYACTGSFDVAIMDININININII